MDTTNVRPMPPGDTEAICDVIGRAFADNPNTLATARGDRARAQRAIRGIARPGPSCLQVLPRRSQSTSCRPSRTPARWMRGSGRGNCPAAV